ncbi:HD domain-containing protein [Schinkia azotoformans]|uniref:HD domain-containing protein n=1 Tax=Schinkia azotoformans TaxID=1454 RepID=UPI002DB5C6FE|nr:HD domain-containing protein [Schinkia azotoformans]MEC1696330.1 HD domain-containing protein [Schinkia azotoformans]MEC1717391.1 HD domain-containing protein [Schinkia azotoformans]MEC1727288.1 HD domain-containing protein [Schinkia azotoformans]MEC1740179.1 HD domain-containing protein [Schinkia azotoformans]MEC1747522.1 HD domain-containing protein [Schinkia azotoformans]
MDKNRLIEEATAFVRSELENEASGHDWWHIARVTKMAKHIAEQEGADVFICEMAALLHDIADEKLNKGGEEAGLKRVKDWLEVHQADNETINTIIEIISTMSFKGGNHPPMTTLEGKVVQDADRLDAIGAIGIARTFAYAGAHGDLIYDPAIHPREKMTKEEYRAVKTTAVNHFYEKLLKLKNLMNTDTAKEMAEARHQLMEDFLQKFYHEWEGNL